MTAPHLADDQEFRAGGATVPESVTPALQVFSSGMGVQSVAAMVLCGQGNLDLGPHLFCNVGDDSENPKTIRYFREIAQPWAAEHGVELIELHRLRRDGSRGETIYQELTRPDSRSVKIPIRAGTTGAPGTRNCTYTWKIAVVRRWAREHGATPKNPYTRHIGLTTDEMQRIGRKNDKPYERTEYPLIDLGLSRGDCMALITEAGLPVPPKSSCYFCPFHTPQTWREMRRDDPEDFERAAELEDLLIERRVRIGRDPAYLTRFGSPLREAIGEAQQTLSLDGWSMDNETCDEGVCFV